MQIARRERGKACAASPFRLLSLKVVFAEGRVCLRRSLSFFVLQHIVR